MRAVIQKVTSASVTVEKQTISSIQKGLMILIGIGNNDNKEDADKLCKKIVNLRIFEDENDKFWKKSIKDIKGEILSVSQFTLMAKTVKGTKPDFHNAMNGGLAIDIYKYFLSLLENEVGKDNVKDGEFGAMMKVELINDGPVTLIVDTREKNE